jgi:tetratricopeptide (TPR) repeat protein
MWSASRSNASKLWSFVLPVGLAVILVLASCGEDGSRSSTAAQHNEEGWGSYILGDYAEAGSHFTEALRLDPGLFEARLGLAWTQAQQGEYVSAVDNFTELLDSGALMEDSFAGRAAVALEVPDERLAVASAESTLARAPNYFFGRRPAYNFYDLRLIMAQAYFALSEYSNAQGQVDVLDPENGLDPGNPETWMVDGVSYPTYQAALAIEIEHLWAVENGDTIH